MKQAIIKLYYRVNDRILDYRYKVPKTSGICFAYYLIMSIIPICSLLAFLSYFLNIDLTLFRQVLQVYLSEEFAAIVIDALSSREVGLSSIVVIAVSVFVVSRGINQLYGISKNLFPAAHERHIITEQILMLFKTIGVLILLLIIIGILTFLPVISSIMETSDYFLIDVFYLYVAFFIVLFLLYKIIPDCHVHVLDIVQGAACASALLLLVLGGLNLYFQIADYNSIYGPLASIVVIMISFTIIAEMIYIGMYIMFEAHMKRLIIAMQKRNKEAYPDA